MTGISTGYKERQPFVIFPFPIGCCLLFSYVKMVSRQRTERQVIKIETGRRQEEMKIEGESDDNWVERDFE